MDSKAPGNPTTLPRTQVDELSRGIPAAGATATGVLFLAATDETMYLRYQHAGNLRGRQCLSPKTLT